MINAWCLFTPSAKRKKCSTQIGIDLSPYSLTHLTRLLAQTLKDYFYQESSSCGELSMGTPYRCKFLYCLYNSPKLGNLRPMVLTLKKRLLHGMCTKARGKKKSRISNKTKTKKMPNWKNIVCRCWMGKLLTAVLSMPRHYRYKQCNEDELHILLVL